MKKAFFATVIMIFMFCTLTMSANARSYRERARATYDATIATYDATIKAHCNTESRDIVVSLTKDRSSSGQTPQTFTSLTGSHTFTVPSTDTNGHPFTQWSNGATSTTITLTSAGTYTANYQASTSYTYTYTVATLAELTSVISKVVPGDTVLIRGGIYQPTSPIIFRISGTSGSPITYEAYPNEKVIFDGSLTTDASLGGDGSWEPPMIYVYKGCNWNIFRNIEIRYSAGSGITMWGDDNVLDHVEVDHNKGIGALAYGDRCKFLYCIAHDNIDTQHSPPGQDADGLGAGEDCDDVNYVASGCYFLGCLCYGNSDDGIDCLGSTGNTIEKCVCHHNGLLQGDGRGFVLATGGSNHASKCIAYNNAKFGFADDDTPAPNNIIDHCTAYNNGKAGFLSNMKSIDIGTFTNNIGTLVVYDAVPIQHYNTWNLGITNYGFVSTDSTSVDFLSLLVNSLCRSKASDGSDLGALQYGERISDLLGT